MHLNLLQKLSHLNILKIIKIAVDGFCIRIGYSIFSVEHAVWKIVSRVNASAYRSRRDETKRKEGFKARILTRSGGLTRAAVRQRGSARVARPPSFFNRQSEAGARSRGSRSRMHLNWTNERGIPAGVRGGEGGFGGRRGRGEAVATPLRACVHKRFHGAEAGALRAAPLPGQRRDGPVRP